MSRDSKRKEKKDEWKFRKREAIYVEATRT